MVRLAVLVTPLSVAEIAAVTGVVTAEVVTVKLADVAPGGIVTLGGTCAAPLLLCRETVSPAAGALRGDAIAALRGCGGAATVTVPVAGFGPITKPGESTSEFSTNTVCCCKDTVMLTFTQT